VTCRRGAGGSDSELTGEGRRRGGRLRRRLHLYVLPHACLLPSFLPREVFRSVVCEAGDRERERKVRKGKEMPLMSARLVQGRGIERERERERDLTLKNWRREEGRCSYLGH
jgi:hypothetical protein